MSESYFGSEGNRFHDPHRSMSMDEGGSSPFGYVDPNEEMFSFSHGPRNREVRLYNQLMNQGRFAELDKAKHNEQYRNYLLENFEDDMFF